MTSNNPILTSSTIFRDAIRELVSRLPVETREEVTNLASKDKFVEAWRIISSHFSIEEIKGILMSDILDEYIKSGGIKLSEVEKKVRDIFKQS